MVPAVQDGREITSTQAGYLSRGPGLTRASYLAGLQIGNLPTWSALAREPTHGSSVSGGLKGGIREVGPPPVSPWLTSAEAAHYLRYRSTQGLRDAVNRGELRASKRGRTLLFHLDDLDAYLRSQSISPKYFGPTEAATQREKPMVRPTTRKPEVPHEGTSGEDPYDLRAALTDDQAERDSKSRCRPVRQHPGRNTSEDES